MLQNIVSFKYLVCNTFITKPYSGCFSRYVFVTMSGRSCESCTNSVLLQPITGHL